MKLSEILAQESSTQTNDQMMLEQNQQSNFTHEFEKQMLQKSKRQISLAKLQQKMQLHIPQGSSSFDHQLIPKTYLPNTYEKSFQSYRKTSSLAFEPNKSQIIIDHSNNYDSQKLNSNYNRILSNSETRNNSMMNLSKQSTLYHKYFTEEYKQFLDLSEEEQMKYFKDNQGLMKEKFMKKNHRYNSLQSSMDATMTNDDLQKLKSFSQ
eukprot:403363431